MDAITLLRNDHKTVEQLFKRFEKAGDSALVEKRQIVDRIIEELSIHAAIEEQLFYPVARATVPGTEDIALESLEEHHIVKWVLSELDGMDPADERFDAKVTVLIENVRHHVEEEESDFFPKVRDELGRKRARRPRRRDGEGQGRRHRRTRTPARPTRRPATSSSAPSPAWSTASATPSAASPRAASPPSRTSSPPCSATRSRRPRRPGPRRAQAGQRRAQDGRGGDGHRRQDGPFGRVGRSRHSRAAKAGAKGTTTSAKKSATATTTTAKRATTTTAAHGEEGRQGNGLHRQDRRVQDRCLRRVAELTDAVRRHRIDRQGLLDPVQVDAPVSNRSIYHGGQARPMVSLVHRRPP